MSLSREEFWVLDTTAHFDSPFDISSLNASNADKIFNKHRHHGLSTNELADLFIFMQKQGDIVLFLYPHDIFSEFYAEEPPPRSPSVRYRPDCTEIWNNAVFYSKAAIIADFFADAEYQKRNANRPYTERERYPDNMHGYCLTPQGAEKWEQTAQVDWNKFLDCRGYWDWEDTDLSEQQSLTIWRVAALHKETLDAYFDWKIRWDNKLYSWETSSFKRYHTERISPWRATYWKTFPEGFECDYLEFTLHREKGLTSKEHAIAEQQSAGQWPEHHAMFDWCNSYVRDFPFEGD